MKRAPTFDEIFATMSAASVGDSSARVAVPEDPQLDDLATRFAIALNLLLDDLAFRFVELVQTTKSLEIEVAERRRAEEALRVSEQSLAATLDSIGDAVISTDVDGRIVRMNPVAESLTGWALREARGRLLAEVFRILNEDTRRPVESPVERVLREGVVVGLANHTALISRDGTERAIADSGAPIRDPEGRMRGVVLVFRDQTEERKAEKALRESEARKSSVMEAALDGIVMMDHEGAIIEFNPAARRVDLGLMTPWSGTSSRQVPSIGRLDISDPASISLTGYDRLRMHCLLDQGKRRP